MNIHSFDNGLTVAELKRIVANWPETNEEGEPAEVWVADREGTSNQVHAIWPLNKRMTGEGIETADLMLHV